MNSADSFSHDYAEARRKFREAAVAAGAILERQTNPNDAPDGGDLTTDVALIGPSDAERFLVLTSGTHGVEGFCGWGAEGDWLRRGGAERLPSGVAALLIHAVNPYGFAWLRRVNEDNVDLNRNWIDFSEPRPENPEYAELADVICPRDWTEEVQRQSRRRLAEYEASHGPGALRRVTHGGQYSHPAGIFYGGAAPSWSRLALTAILQRHLAGAAKVAIIDYHTGLGPWGFGEEIVMEPGWNVAFRRAQSWYGAAAVAGATSGVRGDAMSAAPALLAHAEVTAMAVEFGTVAASLVFQALRGDAWLHAHGDIDSEQGRAVAGLMR
jgi:hypothetical protein